MDFKDTLTNYILSNIIKKDAPLNETAEEQQQEQDEQQKQQQHQEHEQQKQQQHQEHQQQEEQQHEQHEQEEEQQHKQHEEEEQQQQQNDSNPLLFHHVRAVLDDLDDRSTATSAGAGAIGCAVTAPLVMGPALAVAGFSTIGPFFS